MLPTTGHFKDIECPYFDDACDRPYCHFRHRRKNTECTEHEEVHEEPTKEVPTYKPTPKSQLNTRGHIPISYVPDLAVPSNRRLTDRQITYKPTPISVLTTNKAGSSLSLSAGDKNVENETKRESSPMNLQLNCEYNPEISLQDDTFNFEELATEFDMIDDIISDCDKPISSPEREKPEPNKSSSTSSKTKHSKDKKESRSDSKHSSRRSNHDKKHEKRDRDKSRHEHKSSRHKRDKSEPKKEEKKESRSDKHSRHKHKEKEREKSKEKKEKIKTKEEKEKNGTKHKENEKIEIKMEKSPEIFIQDDDIDDDHSDDNSMMDFDDDFEEDSTLAECYRIFNEYQPAEAKEKEKETEVIEKLVKEEENPVGKKRVAHEKAENITSKQYTRPKEIINAAQMMSNRFRIARMAQASNEQNDIFEEIKKHAIKRPSTVPASSVNNKIQKIQIKKITVANSTSVVDDILSSSTKPAKTYSILNTLNKPAVRRIAPVQNVNLIQRAKAKIEEITKQNAINVLNKTICQTVAKGNKRVAHVPEFSLSDIPDVLSADKSKLPVNVRTRYLTMLADECVKLYLTREDAYQRALGEEFKCYERCKTLATYRNSAMLSVNRIRKELQEREKSALGPISLDDNTLKEDKKGDGKGVKFYENIQQYVLTEEELILHGYPRESSTPGRACIQSQKQAPKVNLQENERICARCSKIYFVDLIGLPLHEEQCIYHPLRKRTLRGERTYLCCKSTDDVGCVTSSSHVCDTPADFEAEGYQTTMEPENETDPRSYAVYALDCEMCYTTKGLELTRVTIVDVDLKTVYESLVKPLNPIVDYNTRFSGITKDQMDRTSTSILQVQANILHLCNSKTILIGHSLESDMKALKIIHSTIIDTAVLFPHKFGLPHKRALKALASDYLKKIIQNDVSGHDSAEDALTCMELILWKVKEEKKLRGIK